MRLFSRQPYANYRIGIQLSASSEVEKSTVWNIQALDAMLYSRHDDEMYIGFVKNVVVNSEDKPIIIAMLSEEKTREDHEKFDSRHHFLQHKKKLIAPWQNKLEHRTVIYCLEKLQAMPVDLDKPCLCSSTTRHVHLSIKFVRCVDVNPMLKKPVKRQSSHTAAVRQSQSKLKYPSVKEGDSLMITMGMINHRLQSLSVIKGEEADQHSGMRQGLGQWMTASLSRLVSCRSNISKNNLYETDVAVVECGFVVEPLELVKYSLHPVKRPSREEVAASSKTRGPSCVPGNDFGCDCSLSTVMAAIDEAEKCKLRHMPMMKIPPALLVTPPSRDSKRFNGATPVPSFSPSASGTPPGLVRGENKSTGSILGISSLANGRLKAATSTPRGGFSPTS